MFAILYAPNWHSSQLNVVAITAGVTKRPVLLKALFAMPCNAASALPARAFFKADSELTYPASRANAATLARPMTRHRMKGSWKKVGGSFSDMAGISRCGTKDRQICAVTTRTEAMPRRPCHTESAVMIRRKRKMPFLDTHLPTRHLSSPPLEVPSCKSSAALKSHPNRARGRSLSMRCGMRCKPDLIDARARAGRDGYC